MNLLSCHQRNERVEAALAGFEMAQYVSPVVRVDEDEDYEDIVPEMTDSSDTAEDLFAQFFSNTGKFSSAVFFEEKFCYLRSVCFFPDTLTLFSILHFRS